MSGRWSEWRRLGSRGLARCAAGRALGFGRGWWAGRPWRGGCAASPSSRSPGFGVWRARVADLWNRGNCSLGGTRRSACCPSSLSQEAFAHSGVGRVSPNLPEEALCLYLFSPGTVIRAQALVPKKSHSRWFISETDYKGAFGDRPSFPTLVVSSDFPIAFSHRGQRVSGRAEDSSPGARQPAGGRWASSESLSSLRVRSRPSSRPLSDL